MNIIKKKGQGHVEMILSFVLFVSFLLFVFAFLNPFAKSKEPDYVMGMIQESIIENLSIDVGVLTVFPNDTLGCYNLSQKITDDYGSNYYEDVGGNGRKYDLYFSGMLNPSAAHRQESCPEANYTLGVYSKEKLIFEDSVQQLVSGYSSGYDKLKGSLGINKEFSLIVEDKNKNLIFIAERKIPDNIEVESKEIPIRTIDKNAKIKEMILVIRTW